MATKKSRGATATATKRTKTSKPAAKAAKVAKPAKRAAQSAEMCDAPSHAETHAMPHAGSIVHVEFTTPDLQGASKLYHDLFGWQFHPFKPNEMYFQTPGNWGACGCMMQGEAASCSATMLYVNVSDISAMLAKAEKHGATTVKSKTEIDGGHGFYAQVKMPDGNVFGIYSRH